jgi:hypothetical protein
VGSAGAAGDGGFIAPELYPTPPPLQGGALARRVLHYRGITL